LPDSQKFDLIISNHSFEHISDQLETLLKVRKILSENDVCLIRMPVKAEYIWNRYGANWVKIDAPRHFLIHRGCLAIAFGTKKNRFFLDLKSYLPFFFFHF